MSWAAETVWELDWLWGLPLIVMNVVIHAVGLMLIYREVIRIMNIAVVRRRFFPMFVVVMASVALLATVLHGLEATLWALAYRLLNAARQWICNALFTGRIRLTATPTCS